MRNLFVTAVAVATLLTTGALTTRSDAMTTKPAGLTTAIKASKDVAKTGLVCHRRGWGHHARRCVWVPRHHHFRHFR
jgi:hypothetical protein